MDPETQFIPQHLICPLTNKMFVDPVKTVYGTVYERKAIEEHLRLWVNLLLLTLTTLKSQQALLNSAKTTNFQLCARYKSNNNKLNGSTLKWLKVVLNFKALQ